MTEFEEFVDVAIQMGKRIMGRLPRQLPVFVPEGNYQDELYEKSIEYLVELNFKIMDVQSQTYVDAINKFNLKWSSLIGKWPSEEFDEKVSESENRLLIKCGNKNHPRFWKYLCDENLLYTGGELPPIQYLSPRCIVIPDSACVSVIIKHKDFFNNYPLDYFGPVGRYNSNTVPFQI